MGTFREELVLSIDTVVRMTKLEDEVAELRKMVTTLSQTVARLDRKQAYVPPETTVGDGSTIAPDTAFWSAPGKAITVGAYTTISRHAEISGPAEIGERCFVNRDVYIRAHTIIGDRVAIGPFVRFITDSHEIGDSKRRASTNITDPIVIGDGCWIGAGAIILGGVTLGPGCIVAAGAVVTQSFVANTLIGGVPAKMIRHLGN